MTIPALNKKVYEKMYGIQTSTFPERIIQIGDGNFIRGFIDWMVQEMNLKSLFNGKIVSIQATPRGKTVPKLNCQDGLFTLIQRGIENGEITDKKHVVDSISRGINPYTSWRNVLEVAEDENIEFLFSNTTEAGICYEKENYLRDVSPKSFPGKVVALLYHRYIYFQGQQDKGWIIIPCELIENNGDVLKKICLKVIEDWEFPVAFSEWIHSTCTFCNTLVDRIVPGYPEEDAILFEQLGYSDKLLTVAEPYHLFVIEGPAHIEKKLPFKEAGLNIHFDNIASYRALKVKLLNAPHTMLASIGLLSGIETVKEAIEDPLLISFLKKVLVEEICVTLTSDEKEKAQPYIEEIFNRFANPFLHHRLADISLNSYSKFKARVWPSICDYKNEFGENPKRLIFAFASLLHFFSNVNQEGSLEVKDDQTIINKFCSFYEGFDNSEEMLVKFVGTLIQEDFPQCNENMEDLYKLIAQAYLEIHEKGIKNALVDLEREGDL